MSFQQRVVTVEEFEAHSAAYRSGEPLCGGCLKVRVNRDELCPECDARYHATDALNSSVNKLMSTAENFPDEIYAATALWRREDQPAHDVDAAREELRAAYEAVVSAADKALGELGRAEGDVMEKTDTTITPSLTGKPSLRLMVAPEDEPRVAERLEAWRAFTADVASDLPTSCAWKWVALQLERELRRSLEIRLGEAT